MGQKEYSQYYDRAIPVSFGDQAFAYRKAIASLSRQNPSILVASEPKTFVLGGFHPNTDTPESFIRFAQTIHPNHHDLHILLDQNRQPLESRHNPEQYPHRLQSVLEASPLRPSSIDFMVLDGTLNFMNANRIRHFADDASNFISQDGLVLATIRDVPNNPIARFHALLRSTAANHVDQHLYTSENLAYLTHDQLKPVLVACFKIRFKHMRSVIVLSRKDSQLQQHSGNPFFYSQN